MACRPLFKKGGGIAFEIWASFTGSKMIIVENCCEKNQVPQIFLYLFVAQLHRRKLQLFLFSATRGNFDKKKVRQTSPRKGWNCTSVENSGKSWYGAKVHSFRWTGVCWGWVGGYSFKKLYNGLVLERFAGVFSWMSASRSLIYHQCFDTFEVEGSYIH